MRFRLIPICTILLCCLVFSCSSRRYNRKDKSSRYNLPQNRVTTIQITSEPGEADVYLNYRYAGKTPFQISHRSRNRQYKIRLEKAGFLPVKKHVRTYKNGKSNYNIHANLSLFPGIDCYRAAGVQPEIDPVTGVPAAVWITDQKADIMTCPVNGIPLPLTKKRMARFFLAEQGKVVVENTPWRLLLQNIKKPERNHFIKVGWIEESKLLDDHLPLMNPNTLMNYKVIVSHDHNLHKTKIPLFSNPNLLGEPISWVPVDSIYYIWRLNPAQFEGEIENTIPRAVTSLLIGRAPSLNSLNSDGSKNVEGWIDIANVTLWNTGKALSFLKSVPVYKDRVSAIRHNSKKISHYLKNRGNEGLFSRNPVLEEMNGLYKIYLKESQFKSYRPNFSKKTGWINLKPGNNSYRYVKEVYLVSYKNMIRLYNLINDLQKVSLTPLSIHQSWVEIIKTYTDETCEPDIPIGTCLERTTTGSFIPLKNMFLNYSIAELVELMQVDFTKAKDVFCDLKRTNMMIQAVLDNKKVELGNAEGASCNIQVKSTRKNQYWFKSGDFSQYAWLPEEDLP